MIGVVAQLVRASACHAEGRGSESRPPRQHRERSVRIVFSVLARYRRTRKPQRDGARRGRENFQRKIIRDRVPPLPFRSFLAILR